MLATTSKMEIHMSILMTCAVSFGRAGDIRLQRVVEPDPERQDG